MFPQLHKAKTIADRLRAAGATHCQLVGGCVRDHLLGKMPKDIDIEVFGLRYDQIADALNHDFRVDVVGQSFGVIKIDNEIDISLPRSESKCGVGHTGFMVTVDPMMTPRDAAARRDFTINSLAMDFDGQIFDFFGGQEDLNRKILRATTAAFQEDPLRVLRGMQFAARFGFQME
ncbi:MAG: CCA tRNA nucleotidyltransferase, partial [Pirellulales bacterium]|nr:CCA tRNA nucleotidyltransferase [Pirellulales bacterium]